MFGCFPKSGRSTADDHLRDIKAGLASLGLTLKDVIAGTMDTEATMISLMSLLKAESIRYNLLSIL